MSLVEEYTALGLTFTLDWFREIAGVAKQFRHFMTNPNYMARLWEEFPIEGMSRCRKDGVQKIRPLRLLDRPGLGLQCLASSHSVSCRISIPR